MVAVPRVVTQVQKSHARHVCEVWQRGELVLVEIQLLQGNQMLHVVPRYAGQMIARYIECSECAADCCQIGKRCQLVAA